MARPLGTKTFLAAALGLLFVFLSVVVLILVNSTMKRLALTNAEHAARMLLDHNLAIHTYFSEDLKPKLFEKLGPVTSKDYFEPVWMSSTYAVRKMDGYFRHLNPHSYYYKECAANARSPENEADGYEKAFLADLQENPKLTTKSEIRFLDGKPYFTVLRRGEMVEESCLRCHGSPDKAPGDLVRHYGPDRSFHRKVGRPAQVISIRIPLSEAFSSAITFSYYLSGSLLVILVGGVLFAWVGNKRLVIDPIAKIREHALRISTERERLGETIPEPKLTELRELVAAFNKMSLELKKIYEEQAKATEALYRLNRELRAVSYCNQVLLRVEDEQTLLNEICRIICDEAGYRLAWVGYAENDDAKTIRPVAWAGFDSGYIADAELSWADDTERGRGPAGIVIRSGEMVYVQDFTTDPRMIPWRENALQRGYRSGIALPLKDEALNVFGALLIYHSEPNAMSLNEIRLMEELAGDLAFGVTVLRTRMERKRAENIMLARFRLVEYSDSHSLDEFLQETLDELEALTGSSIGFYHFVESDQKTLSLRAWSTRTLREMCTAEGKGLHYDIDQAGVWVDCVHERRPVIHNDYKALPHRRGMPVGHAEVIRELVVPVFRGDRLVAILGVGNKPSDYSARDIDTVSCLADLAWDIAERKRAEEALRASEERFRTVADWTYDWEYWEDPLGRLKYMSPSCKRVTGFAPEEFADDPGLLGRIVHPMDREAYEQHMHLIRERHVDIEEAILEYRIIALDGTVHWIEHVCRPVYGAAGASLGRRVSNRDVTEREKAQQALRKSEEQYRAVFDNAGMGIDLLDRDGRIVRVNKALSNMLGYGGEELHHLTFLDITHPEDREISSRNLEALTAGEIDSYRLEKRYVKKDGSIVWADLWSTAVRDENGDHAGTVAVIDDITKRKHVEQDLARQVTLMESLLEAIPAPVFFKNTDHVYIGCNTAFAEFLGRPKEHIIGKSVFEIAPKELAELYRTQDDALFKSPGSQVYEASAMSSDGSRHDVVFHKAAFLDSVGSVAGLIGVILDITDRKKVEEALRESEAFYRSLYQNISDCIFIMDVTPDGRFKFVGINPAEEKALGMTTEQVANKYTDDLYSQEVAEHINSRYVMCVEKRKTIHYEEVLDPPKGKMSFLTSLVPIEGPDGRIYRIIGVARDISEQQSLQRQLLQAQKMEAIGTLSGGIAHDFNNVLQVALGYSEIMLDDEELPARCRIDLQKIRDSAKRGADLVQRLLTFSRKMEIKPQPIDLNLRITELRKMLERTIPKMVDIQIIQDAKLATINADKTQIDQVVMNLAVNARDAMPDGGKLIFETANVMLDEEYAGIHLDAEPGHHVLLMVTDTGLGIDKDTLEHIFEPFYTTKGVGEGTGLGLAMVHGIVKQHSGHIRCYSEPGAGTTFKIYFPALISDEEQEETRERSVPRGGSETILLVDDEELIRDLGSRILTKAGYTVITACNGKEALDVSQERSHDIDLVILDVIMPEMGGKQCLETLLSLNPSARVVIASGFSANGSTKETLAAGAKGFVNKPYEIRQMLEVVRDVLDAE
ncbi:MAG: PAS domain S-box protein [Pseudomonadota bacterium]